MSTTTSFHPLDALPPEAELRSVTSRPAAVDERRVLQVQLAEEVVAHGVPGVDFIDQPTFVIIPADFTFGTLSVDLRSGLAPAAPDYARTFAGLAYHIADDRQRFEAVYLRPLNGLALNPPAPRQLRAVQYFAYPEWPFDRLRGTYPEGVYEAGVDIRPDTWTHLELDVSPRGVVVTVDGVTVLTIDDPKSDPAAGDVGLFVDIGTRAYFRDLTITGSQSTGRRRREE